MSFSMAMKRSLRTPIRTIRIMMTISKARVFGETSPFSCCVFVGCLSCPDGAANMARSVSNPAPEMMSTVGQASTAAKHTKFCLTGNKNRKATKINRNILELEQNDQTCYEMKYLNGGPVE